MGPPQVNIVAGTCCHLNSTRLGMPFLAIEATTKGYYVWPLSEGAEKINKSMSTHNAQRNCEGGQITSPDEAVSHLLDSFIMCLFVGRFTTAIPGFTVSLCIHKSSRTIISTGFDSIPRHGSVANLLFSCWRLRARLITNMRNKNNHNLLP